MLTKAAFIWSKIQSVLRWLRELNALQIDKAPAKKKKKTTNLINLTILMLQMLTTKTNKETLQI